MGILDLAADERRNTAVILGAYSIRWEDVDEDLSTEGLLRGAPAPRPSLAKAS